MTSPFNAPAKTVAGLSVNRAGTYASPPRKRRPNARSQRHHTDNAHRAWCTSLGSAIYASAATNLSHGSNASALRVADTGGASARRSPQRGASQTAQVFAEIPLTQLHGSTTTLPIVATVVARSQTMYRKASTTTFQCGSAERETRRTFESVAATATARKPTSPTKHGSLSAAWSSRLQTTRSSHAEA